MTMRKYFVYISVALLSYCWFYYVKQGPVYSSNQHLNGKTVLITGGNSGVGKAAAIEFARKGARVVIASRNQRKSVLAREEIIKESGGKANVRIMSLDLENLASVRKFAKDFDETENYLDILVNNAGVLGLLGQTKDKINRAFAINHLGPFLLTTSLIEKMKKQANTRPVRIINVASEAYLLGSINFTNIYPQTQPHEGFFAFVKNYADSKLANLYFTAELHRRFEQFGITAYSLHPGSVTTEIAEDFRIPKFLSSIWFFLITRSPFYGCQTILYCALDDDVIRDSGSYFQNCAESWCSDFAKDGSIARRLWLESERIVDSLH